MHLTYLQLQKNRRYNLETKKRALGGNMIELGKYVKSLETEEILDSLSQIYSKNRWERNETTEKLRQMLLKEWKRRKGNAEILLTRKPKGENEL